jgi:hypothetical protein
MSETILLNDVLSVDRYTGPELGYSGDRTRYQITCRLSGMLITLSAAQWENLRAALGGEHPGIELRISNMSGELTRANSDDLHHAAKYGNPGWPDDWQQLLPGIAWPADTPPPAILKIEIRPVTLGGAGVDVADAGGQGAENAQSPDPANVDAIPAEGLSM